MVEDLACCPSFAQRLLASFRFFPRMIAIQTSRMKRLEDRMNRAKIRDIPYERYSRANALTGKGARWVRFPPPLRMLSEYLKYREIEMYCNARVCARGRLRGSLVDMDPVSCNLIIFPSLCLRQELYEMVSSLALFRSQATNID